MKTIAVLLCFIPSFFPIDFKGDSSVLNHLTEKQKMLSMGYTEEEISRFSKEKMQEFADMELIKVAKSVTNFLSPEHSKNKALPSLSFSGPSGYVTKIDSSKTMISTLSLVKIKKGDYRMILKSDVLWNYVPPERRTDILTFNYDSLTVLDKKGDYPKIEMNFSYDNRYYFMHYSPGLKKKIIDKTKKIVNSYDGSNHDKYKLELGSHSIAFGCELPKDKRRSFSRPGRRTAESTTYSNFKISMVAHFSNSFSHMRKAAFQCVYLHQKTEWKFDMTNIILSSSPPFVELTGVFKPNSDVFEKNPLNTYLSVDMEEEN